LDSNGVLDSKSSLGFERGLGFERSLGFQRGLVVAVCIAEGGSKGRGSVGAGGSPPPGIKASWFGR
jgi:hypothetical protein